MSENSNGRYLDVDLNADLADDADQGGFISKETKHFLQIIRSIRRIRPIRVQQNRGFS